MAHPSEFYNTQINTHQEALSALKKQLIVSSIARLLVFTATVYGIYFFFGNVKAVAAVIIVGIIAFLFLLTRHSGLQYRRDLKRQLIALNEIELAVLNRNFNELPEGNEYKNDTHFYSQDIDLFGKGSFFQYANRTALKGGADYFANVLLSNNIDTITSKQEAIKELSNLPTWRQQFAAIASLVKTEVSSSSVISWMKQYTAFVPSFFSWFPLVFSIISSLLLGSYFFGFVSGYIVFFWFLLGLGISGVFFKKVNRLSAHTSQIQSTFQQYSRLIHQIESQHFKATLLQEKSSNISQSPKASQVLKQFSRNLNALDQRNNMLIGIVTNGFMLRDLKQSLVIERWIASHKEQVEQWFEVIHFFDAYASLGNFSYNHPSYSFPIITSENPLLKVDKGAHPLLDPATAIYNDFEIQAENFFIVTGANMAGKSTFLRTVALQIVMANVGLSTNAKASTYHPIKLITSMRTTDSLTDDASYFFSELQRLKYIVEAIKDHRYFIILDEILKGTNSTDKAEGSKKFIEKLVKSKASGIIATHDLSLCDTATQFEQVKNYYFDAEIKNDELFFDYTFKEGICQNMNASFLLKKMGIVDS